METASESPIIARLKQFMAYTGMTSTQFADKAAIPRPSMSQLLHGRNKSINNQILAKLDVNFPMLNTLWLLFGRGEMLVNSNIEISEAEKTRNSQAAASQVSDCLTANCEDTVEYMRSDQSQSGAPQAVFNSEDEKSTVSDGSVPDSAVWTASVLCSPPEDATAKNKKIKSIIVFYSDNSFETFLPSV